MTTTGQERTQIRLSQHRAQQIARVQPALVSIEAKRVARARLRYVRWIQRAARLGLTIMDAPAHIWRGR